MTLSEGLKHACLTGLMLVLYVIAVFWVAI